MGPLIVHIETATSTCSVALSEGDELLGIKESHEEKSHAAQLAPFLKEVVTGAGKSFRDLDAVAVSIGPGSYTGLRIGISTAKGLAFGLDIPVLAVNTLESLTRVAAEPALKAAAGSKQAILLCPMLDARRMEVYTALYRPDLSLFRDVDAEIIDQDSFSDLLATHTLIFFGNGAPKCKPHLNGPSALYLDDVRPSASGMIPLALNLFNEKRFEDTAYFEPRYLKEFIATTPKKKLL